jgi:hypothetical protein
VSEYTVFCPSIHFVGLAEQATSAGVFAAFAFVVHLIPSK